MKKIYLLGAAFLISLGITGCTPATTATPPASKPASTAEQQEKKYLSLFTVLRKMLCTLCRSP